MQIYATILQTEKLKVPLIFVHIGGRDTAGLGGKGGPYRLDAGHKIYQVSQAEKDAVPEEVRRAAREMAEKAFKERWAAKGVFAQLKAVLKL